MEFLQMNESFSNRQFGFLPGSNTTGACLSAMNEIHDGIESGEFVISVFIDVSKAFDCISHDILLDKLARLGIRGPMKELLSSFLFGRQQRIHSGDTMSKVTPLTHGTPQGSKLSSLLFLIYVNDVLDVPIKAYMQLYADDIMMIYRSNTLAPMIQDVNSDLVKVREWFVKNLLTFNIQKSKYILIGPKAKNVDGDLGISVHDEPLERKMEYKYLGLIIDAQLTWKPHADFIKSKMIPFLALLRKTSFILPDDMKLAIYYSYIHSHLTYLISVWG